MTNPVYYHLHHQNEMGDLPFWNKLANEMGDPILELGCGTGRLLLPLIQAGHEVVGIDKSYPALDYLINQVTDPLENEPMIFQADIERFRLDRKFGLVFMACNTLSTFKRAKRRSVFEQVNDHLLDNGVFAASIPNPKCLASLPEEGESEVEDSFPHPLTANPVQVSSEWVQVDQSVIFQWHYDHLLPDGQVERETAEIRHYLTSIEEYQGELYAAGMHPLEVFGDFDRSEYRDDSPYLIVIAGMGSGFL